MGNRYTQNERKKMIRELQKLAEEVLELKQTHRQKRPIVIEFSGSPKSGKTSCINSLELFLKRNGFSVEIIHERASLCPVADKQSPMFNIWTACMSISGMVGVLERKLLSCDVLILDRGIFDALCWFHWLFHKKMMEPEQREAVEHFLQMESLVNRIDIVFAFVADPEISIEREYTTLLTDKLGTIMNKEVLAEYRSAVEKTVSEKKKYFHSIFEIDTSNKTQDEVGKEVTDTTLSTLSDLLMERIGYFDRTAELDQQLVSRRTFKYDEMRPFLGHINFALRKVVESEEQWIQPIPIVVITNPLRDKVLSVKKNAKVVSGDSPEKDRLLLYIGGHPRYEDFTDINSDDFLSICKYTLRREVKEEIGLSLAFNAIEPFVIYTPDSQKSKQHMGICFVAELETESLKLQLDSQELVTTKGQSKSGRFQNVADLSGLDVEYESWSIEIVERCFGIDLRAKNKQITMFENTFNVQ